MNSSAVVLVVVLVLGCDPSGPAKTAELALRVALPPEPTATAPTDNICAQYARVAVEHYKAEREVARLQAQQSQLLAEMMSKLSDDDMYKLLDELEVVRRQREQAIAELAASGQYDAEVANRSNLTDNEVFALQAELRGGQ